MDFPREESLRWLVTRYAGLQARHGDGIGTPELVQPTGAYFPDAFTPSGDGVARLVARLLEYAPVRDGLDVRLRFLEDEGGEASGGCGSGSCGSGGCGSGSCACKSSGGDADEAHDREGAKGHEHGGGGGCGSGACGTGGGGGGGGGDGKRAKDRVVDTGEGYLLEIPVASVGHPITLTTTLARSVGTVVLAEAGEEVSPGELGGMSELAAIASGFGVIVTSGAHIYGKSCGGARVSRHTHLTVEESAVALALFGALHGVKPGTARTHLETTQRAAFAEAVDWVESNPSIVTQLRTRPEVLEAGMFRCEETKGFLGKILARRAAAEEESVFAFAPARGRNTV
jgi:hypothetical protein